MMELAIWQGNVKGQLQELLLNTSWHYMYMQFSQTQPVCGESLSSTSNTEHVHLMVR